MSKQDILSSKCTTDLKTIETCNLNSYPYVIVGNSDESGKTKVNLKLYTKILGKEKVFVCTFTK